MVESCKGLRTQGGKSYYVGEYWPKGISSSGGSWYNSRAGHKQPGKQQSDDELIYADPCRATAQTWKNSQGEIDQLSGDDCSQLYFDIADGFDGARTTQSGTMRHQSYRCRSDGNDSCSVRGKSGFWGYKRCPLAYGGKYKKKRRNKSRKTKPVKGGETTRRRPRRTRRRRRYSRKR